MIYAPTAAERRALEAVQRGEVTHVYTMRGNHYVTPIGVGPKTLEKLETKRWIVDQDIGHGTGVGRDILKVRLSPAGQEALRS